MPCNITITSVVEDSNTGNVIVQGVVVGCPGGTVTVAVTCGGPSGFSGVFPYNPAGIWEAVIPTNCNCNQPIVVTAHCTSTPLCTITFNSANLCCCPQFTNTFIPHHCTSGSNPQQLFIFGGTIQLFDNCTYNIQRDFGDGSSGVVQTFGPGPGSFTLATETHLYSPGSYTCYIDTISPSGCGSQAPVSFTATCIPCNPTAFPFLNALCTIFQLLFLYILVWGLVLTTLIPSACNSSQALAVSLVAVGFAMAIFIFLVCRSCICSFILLFFGQVLFIMGIVLFMFVIPCCAQPNPYTNPLVAFIIALSTMLSGFILLVVWYFLNRSTCPLSICDFWCLIGGTTVKSCTTIAIFVAILVWISCGATTALLPGLGVSLFVSTAISIFACNQLHTNGCNCLQC